MIVSHEHKFIFLKTKKTAGTSIELALSALCGDEDVITPLTEIDEALRAQGRGAQNWRKHGWWGSPRPFFKRRFLKFTAEDYGFYNHMPGEQARALLNDDKVWRSYFKFAFDRNPWDRQVSWYLYKTKSRATRPSFERFMASRRRAYVNNHELYMLDDALAVDFVGRYENLEEDLNKALQLAGVKRKIAVPRTNVTPNKDESRSYRSYYSPATEALVAEWYQPEIALLGYGF
jgi:hypothetical protein